MSFTLWFMGRPASGKSTLAKRVENRLSDLDIAIENLDGDEVRQNLHPDLGFTREERATNNRRTAYVCKLLNRNGIAAVTAMITPFRDSQQRAREIVESGGKFVLVYVKCPVEVCKERDPKGLYERAEAGKIENFTGVNHPFQEPLNPDIVVDSANSTVEECVDETLRVLSSMDVLSDETDLDYEFDLSPTEERDIKERLRDRGYLD